MSLKSIVFHCTLLGIGLFFAGGLLSAREFVIRLLHAVERRVRNAGKLVDVMLVSRLNPLKVDLVNIGKRFSSSTAMDQIKEVDIDPQGKFKYIQIHVKDKKGNEKLIVRGFKSSFHSEILDAVQSQLKGFDCESPGGGRIVHEPERKRIFVFGYSMSFGLANHEKTCELIRKYYPDYTVDWSNDGY